MEFNSVKNTDLLWKTLYNADKFYGYTKENLQIAHTLFEDTIKRSQNWEMKSLLDHNKRFIQDYLVELNKSNPVLTTYKHEDISHKRIAELDSLYHDKTSEFNAFAPARPKNIDFSDTKTTTDNPLEPLLREILSNQKLILSYLATDKQQVLETDLISLA